MGEPNRPKFHLQKETKTLRPFYTFARSLPYGRDRARAMTLAGLFEEKMASKIISLIEGINHNAEAA